MLTSLGFRRDLRRPAKMATAAALRVVVRFDDPVALRRRRRHQSTRLSAASPMVATAMAPGAPIAGDERRPKLNSGELGVRVLDRIASDFFCEKTAAALGAIYRGPKTRESGRIQTESVRFPIGRSRSVRNRLGREEDGEP